MVTALVAPTAALNDGDRELAARQETRLLTVVRNQVRLGKALEVALLLKRLDHDPDVVLRVHHEEVQEVGKRRRVPVESWWRELLSGGAGHVVVLAVRTHEEVDAELLDGPPVDLGEAHLQHDLLAARPAGQLQHVDHFHLRGARLGNLAGGEHDGGARHAAGENQGLVIERRGDVLPGKQRLEFLLQRGHAGFDNHVVLGTPARRPR